MVYTTSAKRLMHDPAACNHLILSNLVIARINKYQDAQSNISCFLRQEIPRRSCANPPANQNPTHKEESNCTQETKHDKKHVPIKPALPLLRALISQICQTTKACGICKPQPLLKMLPKTRSSSKYCSKHQDHDHNTKDSWALKTFILKLIKERHLKGFLVEHNKQLPCSSAIKSGIRPPKAFIAFPDHVSNYLAYTSTLQLLQI